LRYPQPYKQKKTKTQKANLISRQTLRYGEITNMIMQQVRRRGEVIQVKVLGIMALIDEGM